MRQQDRRDLSDIYDRMCADYSKLTDIFRVNASSNEYNRARAYWLASLETGIKAEEYFGTGGSLKQFLVDNGVIDDCGEFIEEEE